jgi:D-tyrosyl-tRNA(Tyr) deacylase
MRAIVQRVSQASVSIGNQKISEIQKGLLVLVGVKADDTLQDREYLCKKITNLRIFEDEAGKMNLSVKDIGGEILIVPNFTLYGDVRKGARPSFIAAGSPQDSEKVYEAFLETLKTYEVPFQTGQFQADMQVALINDGPVTIMLDSAKLF